MKFRAGDRVEIIKIITTTGNANGRVGDIVIWDTPAYAKRISDNHLIATDWYEFKLIKRNKPMSKAMEALEGSIKKWEGIVEGTGIDDGAENCPLCQMFGKISCEECPVMKKTGEDECRKTPHQDWRIHQSREHYGLPSKINCPTCKKLAQKELDFLISLREPEEDVVSKYQDLKERIDNVTAWDKEADDILQEINPHCLFVITPYNTPDYTGFIRIMNLNLNETKISFDYDSQCEKLQAFKKVLMWLLDHSDIKDNGKEIDQIKEDMRRLQDRLDKLDRR